MLEQQIIRVGGFFWQSLMTLLSLVAILSGFVFFFPQFTAERKKNKKKEKKSKLPDQFTV